MCAMWTQIAIRQVLCVNDHKTLIIIIYIQDQSTYISVLNFEMTKGAMIS